MKSLAKTVIVSYWVCLGPVLTSALNNPESSAFADVSELVSVLNSFKCRQAENVLKIEQSDSFSFLSFSGAFQIKLYLTLILYR